MSTRRRSAAQPFSPRTSTGRLAAVTASTTLLLVAAVASAPAGAAAATSPTDQSSSVPTGPGYRWHGLTSTSLPLGPHRRAAASHSTPPAASSTQAPLVNDSDAGSDAETFKLSGGRWSSYGWLSGAAGDDIPSGPFGNWRGEALDIAGTWDDNNEAQQAMWSLCDPSDPGGYYNWNKPLDLAVGAIQISLGESWAAAAAGAYDARWTAALTQLKSCWGTKKESLLKIRFAHEMNLPNDWRVAAGQEGDFVKAITRFSDLRYKIIPGAQLVLCPNDGTDGELATDVRKLWPGKDAQGRQVANIYAVDSYNSWPQTTTTQQFLKKINGLDDKGRPLGIETHRKLAEQWGVPFAIPEWANNGDPTSEGGGGESPEYIRDFYLWTALHSGNVKHPRPGQVLYEIYFNIWEPFQLWPTTMQPKTAELYRLLPW